MPLVSLLFKLTVCASIIGLACCVLNYLRSPLKKLPGPFLAKFSDLWRLSVAYRHTHIETQQELHAKYGDYVRVGPNMVSIADPNLVKKIYSTRGNFLKSELFSVNDAMQDRRIIPNIFSTRSNEVHSRLLRPVQKLYSFRASREHEDAIDKTILAFCNHLEERFMRDENHGNPCDMSDWLSYVAWDALGEMTFSKRFGFMEQAADVHNMLDTAEKAMEYMGVVGQYPAFDKWLAKNPSLASKFPAFGAAAGLCVERLADRMQNLDEYRGTKDFMNSFLQAREEYPKTVTDTEIISYMIGNILAGADTTSITVKAIMYYVLKNPAIHARLVSELQNAKLSHPAPHSSLEALPYLQACIQEGTRMHPVVGNILERIVPTSGLELSNGLTLPPGTIVGMNAWIIQRRADVYGARPYEYLPERWLRGESEDEVTFEGRVKRMKDTDLAFGGGSRVCLGRPLALIEMSKILATLFGKYKIELVDPSEEWVLNKQWLVWPRGIRVRIDLD